MRKYLRRALLQGAIGAFLAAGACAPALAQADRSATLTVRADTPGEHINRQVFSQFAEHLGHGIYEGVWVGPGSKISNVRGYRTDVVEALKALSVPVVRWPGG